MRTALFNIVGLFFKPKFYANDLKILAELKLNICAETTDINAYICEYVIENYDIRITKARNLPEI